MPRTVSVLFVSAEVYPFAKTGGLADVSYGLAMALRELGFDIRVMLPKYGCISERKNHIHEIRRLRIMEIPIGDRLEPISIKSSTIQNPRARAQVYVITNQHYFDSRKGLYADPQTGKLYPDNDERFLFFCRSVVEMCRFLRWFPEIIHYNDWQTGMLGAYVRTLYPTEFRRTRLVFTLHSLADQGVFPPETLAKTGLPQGLYDRLLHRGMVNFVRAGIEFADYVTTVSPTYAREILSGAIEAGGIEEVLRERHPETFVGLLNGVDSTVWNPRSDPYLLHHYDVDTVWAVKPLLKRQLLQRFELRCDPKIPVLGVISRLHPVKGIDLFLEAIPTLLERRDVEIVFLGDGLPEYRTALQKLQRQFPRRLALHLGFDEPLAHLIEAGSDMFLMPSLQEPCGQNQMYSMLYGTVPIVRATGGLRDTVRDFDPETGEGTGIVFEEPTPEAFLAAIERARQLYFQPELWQRLVVNAMLQDFSWRRAAQQYGNIYRALVKGKELAQAAA
ncbi:MAG: glycogen synthase [Candidatus Kapabacteria bacterium]|nr:glycogen synthase [Candidatus Kapabacteria bacterium]MDW7996550.1 glycogen/starch synthase [Bacteroidota bacterium]